MSAGAVTALTSLCQHEGRARRGLGDSDFSKAVVGVGPLILPGVLPESSPLARSRVDVSAPAR
jgi:hypothetical protein